MLSGDNGLLKKAEDARDDTVVGQEKEQVELAYISAAVKKLGDDVTEGELQEELDANFGDTGKTDETKKKTKVTRNANNTLNVLFRDTQHNYNVNDGKVAKVEEGNGGNDDTTTDLAKLQEYFSKGPTVFLEEDMTTYKNVEPITDATTNLKDIAFLGRYNSIIKYKTNIYKVQFSNDPSWTASVSSINIDLNTFGVYDIGEGTNVLVIPSTLNNLIYIEHGYVTSVDLLEGGSYMAIGSELGYFYSNGVGNADTNRPFIGYATMDYNGNKVYYDEAGNIVVGIVQEIN